MEDFLATLRDWQPFFSTVALASATLVGLLFVSLSVARGRGGGLPPRDLARAQGSFGDFLYVLMIGLVFLVPHRAPVGLAVALLVLGAARAIGLARQAVRARPQAPTAARLDDLLRDYAIPGFASLGLIFIGAEVLVGATSAVFVLVLVIAALLTTGSWNAWLLLVLE